MTPGATPITASILFTPAPVESFTSPSESESAAPVPATSGPEESSPLVAQPSTAVQPAREIGVPPSEAAPVSPDVGATATAPGGQPISSVVPGVSRGFAYSVIWFLPLVIGVLGWLLAWALTRSPVPEDA